MLTAFFKAVGVDYVFDTTFSKDLALIERYSSVYMYSTIVHIAKYVYLYHGCKLDQSDCSISGE